MQTTIGIILSLLDAEKYVKSVMRGTILILNTLANLYQQTAWMLTDMGTAKNVFKDMKFRMECVLPS